ncbi:MAG: FkbM family methyltransferase [Magnetovibrio sp.]|nr:FkbM family methyltransferase [Magnetovibrio sp.]
MSDPQSIDYDAIESRVPIGVIKAETGDVAFYMPSQMAAMRFQTLFTKEPETARWISGFAPGGVLVDIGANIGGYTIWAAKHRRMRVFAFEPEAQNFAYLNKNIILNSLDDQVTAFPAAISDETRFSVLNLGDTRIGGSLNSFAEPVDENLEPREPLYRQGSVATSLDQLVADGVLPVPDHIKIDVDGFEHKVVAGARTVLADPGVSSVLIELNNTIVAHREILDVMAGLGFDAPPELSNRLAEKGGGNCIFRRAGAGG